jgi:hypothetical protein
MNKWTHVALQFDADNLATVYVDGKVIKTEQLSGKLLSTGQDTFAYRSWFNIGRRDHLGGTPFFTAHLMKFASMTVRFWQMKSNSLRIINRLFLLKTMPPNFLMTVLKLPTSINIPNKPHNHSYSKA